jgi:hypothetical protein
MSVPIHHSQSKSHSAQRNLRRRKKPGSPQQNIIFRKKDKHSKVTDTYYGGWIVNASARLKSCALVRSSRLLYALCLSARQQPSYVPGNIVLLSTDHELIPARNAGLAAMHGSASRSNVRYYQTWKYSPLKGINKHGFLQCLNCQTFAVRITTSLYRWPIGSLPFDCMVSTPPALH